MNFVQSDKSSRTLTSNFLFYETSLSWIIKFALSKDSEMMLKL
jgi:hypothetical protein